MRMPTETPWPGRARLLLFVALVLWPVTGWTQTRPPGPWLPPGLDSLRVAAAQVKVQFQSARGDSVGGENFKPYERVGGIARHLLRDLGRADASQALGIKAAMDSLGLDTQVAIDPAFPTFSLVLVRNPWRLRANPVGFLYWWKGNDLRIQGALYFGGAEPLIKVWWTGEPGGPYELGVVDKSQGGEAALHFTLYRLNSTGDFWNLVQYEGYGPDLGGVGSAAWTDLNRDGIPELVTWVNARNDSLFGECKACPKLITENTFVRRSDGFELLEQRMVPTPYATFSLFVRLLLAGDRNAAARLLVSPARVDDAIARGWGKRRGPGTWLLEAGEPQERWPRWLALGFQDGATRRRYVVHFVPEGSRWLIRDWTEESPSAGPKPNKPSASPGRRPGK